MTVKETKRLMTKKPPKHRYVITDTFYTTINDMKENKKLKIENCVGRCFQLYECVSKDFKFYLGDVAFSTNDLEEAKKYVAKMRAYFDLPDLYRNKNKMEKALATINKKINEAEEANKLEFARPDELYVDIVENDKLLKKRVAEKLAEYAELAKDL